MRGKTLERERGIFALAFFLSLFLHLGLALGLINFLPRAFPPPPVDSLLHVSLVSSLPEGGSGGRESGPSAATPEGGGGLNDGSGRTPSPSSSPASSSVLKKQEPKKNSAPAEENRSAVTPIPPFRKEPIPAEAKRPRVDPKLSAEEVQGGGEAGGSSSASPPAENGEGSSGNGGNSGGVGRETGEEGAGGGGGVGSGGGEGSGSGESGGGGSGTGISRSSSDGALAQYARLITARINRAKRYPAEARERNEEGTVKVRFTVSAAGEVSEIHVAVSSGFPALDQAALAAVQNASPFPPLPSQLKKSSQVFTVSVKFTLQ